MCITITFTLKATIKINKLQEANKVGTCVFFVFFPNVYSVVEINIVYLTKSEEEMCELVISKQGTTRKTALLVCWLRIWWLDDWFIYFLI